MTKNLNKIDTNFKVHICAPTFKENEYVFKFINCLIKSTFKNWILYIVNAYPKDKLDLKISEKYRDFSNKIILINGNEDEYWSDSVNRGLYKIKESHNSKDKLIIANVDSSFSNDLLDNLISNHNDKIQLACVSVNEKNKVIKSGIKVKSWLLAYNEHLMVNKQIDQINKTILRVDFLPISFVIFPIGIIDKDFFIDSKYLPHYGGDYAYSLLLNSKGYEPYIDFSSIVKNSEENTGYCVYRKKIKFLKRIKNLFSIKNPSSLRHRFWFVMKYYPLYSKPTAFLSYFFRSLLETLLGGNNIIYLKKIFNL